MKSMALVNMKNNISHCYVWNLCHLYVNLSQTTDFAFYMNV